MVSELKRTPLYPVYQELGAKTVDFGGFEMPVQFSGIIAEHEAVRTAAGLFDVSHMGEFSVQGTRAKGFIRRLVTNDVTKLEPGMAMYSPMTYPDGGTVDDLLVYCVSPEEFTIVVNASNIDKDFAWMQAQMQSGEDVTLINRSSEIALLALQGPNAEKILQPLVDVDLSQISFYRFTSSRIDGTEGIVSRTGYTGEDGFELYVPSAGAITLWHALMESGSAMGLIPCGLGARDTLRLEAKLPLYGHELTDTITPLEAGLSMFVKLESGDFIGRDALLAQKTDGVKRKIVGLKMIDKGIPRAGYTVLSADKEVGTVTSGTMSPTLKYPIALAIVDSDCAQIGAKLMIDVRGKRLAAEVVKTPFYRRKKA